MQSKGGQFIIVTSQNWIMQEGLNIVVYPRVKLHYRERMHGKY